MIHYSYSKSFVIGNDKTIVCMKFWLLSVTMLQLFQIHTKMENNCLTEIANSGHNPVESLEPNPSYLWLSYTYIRRP